MSGDLKVAVKSSFDNVQLLPVRRLSAADSHAAPTSRHRPLARVALFVLIAVVPTLVAATYFIGFAANQYASETRFLVRSPQRASTGLLSGFLQSTGFVRAQDDSYAVTEFIKSRDAVSRLVNKHHLLEMLSRPDADAVARFPPPWSSGSSEALYRYYLGVLKVQTDSASGISTLEIRAFRPTDARDIASALLEESEELVNRLNDRARQDAIREAQKEIDAAETAFAKIQQQLADFRNREAMIDPDKQATSILDLIARLSLDVAEKRARIYEIERQAPASPQVPALKASITAVEDEIARERSRVVGGNASIASNLSQYEGLLLQRELASRRVNSANASLDAARLDAQRQQLYIERIVEPHLPDHAAYPRSIFLTVMTLVVGFSAYLTIDALLRYLRDHAET